MSCHWGNLSWGWQTFFFEKPVLQTRIKSICVCFFKPIQWNRLHRFYPLYPNVIEVQYKIIGTLLHTEIWACKISTDMDISYEKPCSQSLLDQLLLGHWTMCYLYIVRLNPSYTLKKGLKVPLYYVITLCEMGLIKPWLKYAFIYISLCQFAYWMLGTL